MVDCNNPPQKDSIEFREVDPFSAHTKPVAIIMDEMDGNDMDYNYHDYVSNNNHNLSWYEAYDVVLWQKKVLGVFMVFICVLTNLCLVLY